MLREEKKYQVVNGTSYDARTPKEVIDVLERSRREKLRLVITYGDVESGQAWDKDSTPNRGYVSRSTGDIQIPILIRTSRSMGGEAILDHCIVQIAESPSYKTLYKKESNSTAGADCGLSKGR